MATALADEREAELRAKIDALASRADVRLGELLQKRKIKPGAVVNQWSHSRGKHQGELSRAEFRAACLTLGLGPSDAAEIDTVFDTYDEVYGGCGAHARHTRVPWRIYTPVA